jgi:hypothetical protein
MQQARSLAEQAATAAQAEANQCAPAMQVLHHPLLHDTSMLERVSQQAADHYPASSFAKGFLFSLVTSPRSREPCGDRLRMSSEHLPCLAHLSALQQAH